MPRYYSSVRGHGRTFGRTSKLNPAKAILGSYSGESIKVLGEMEVTVQYQDQKKKLNLLVVTGGGTSLLGCDWLRHLRLNFIYEVQLD